MYILYKKYIFKTERGGVAGGVEGWREREREREGERERERERDKIDNTLLHRDKDLSTCRLFCKSVPDDKHSNTQYIKQEFN